MKCASATCGSMQSSRQPALARRLALSTRQRCPVPRRSRSFCTGGALALVVGRNVKSCDEALCVHGVVKQAFAETCTPVQSLTASDSCRLEAGCQAVLDSLQQYSYCHEVAVFSSSTKSVTAWCCRHSLEELQQLVYSAVRCIEGTQETIDSAIRRKTDPVSALELLPTLRLHWMHCTPEC